MRDGQSFMIIYSTHSVQKQNFRLEILLKYAEWETKKPQIRPTMGISDTVHFKFYKKTTYFPIALL